MEPPAQQTDGVSTIGPNETASGKKPTKVGVLLLNLGGPDTLEDVQPFLKNLFADDSIIRLPSQGRGLIFPQCCSFLHFPRLRD